MSETREDLQVAQKPVRVTRKSLKTLQRSATSKDNLVGRPMKKQIKRKQRSLPIDSPSALTPLENPVEYPGQVVTNNQLDKGIQVNIDITDNDLTGDEPSATYWKKLSEKNRAALHEALEKISSLEDKINNLEKENTQMKIMLDEANTFIEVFKEEISRNTNDDTGIDVNDVSTADDSTDNLTDGNTNGALGNDQTRADH